jgi:TonB family protein
VALYSPHGYVLPRDEEPWGRAFGLSLAAHAALAILLIFSGGPHRPSRGPLLTEVNFIEKPAPPPEPVKGVPESAAQAPTAQQAAPSIVSFVSPANIVKMARAVAAPIIQAPIAPSGLGAVGVKKAALAPLASIREILPAKRGPLMPDEGARKGKPLALANESLDQVKRGGAGVPLITQGVTSAGPLSGKALAGEGTLSKPRRAPIEVLKANPSEKDAWGKKQSPFSMEGPLKYRKIKNIQMPPYPRWAEERGLEATVSYRIWVDPKGRVKDNMYLEKTSGFSELDALAKDALMKFVFVTLPDDGSPQEDEWGVATFRFELKK